MTYTGSRCLITVLAFSTVLTAQQWPRIEVDGEQADRQRWFYDQRAYPQASIPAGARLDAIRRIGQLDAVSRRRHLASQQAGRQAVDRLGITMDAANWSLIGPAPTDAGTSFVTAGRVNAIAIDPRDNNVVYIGAAEGGVWKTTNGGVNWIPLTDGQPSLASGAIAIDPQNPDTVYVGTGEENFTQDSYYGAGILKSTDAGATWTNIVGPFLRVTIGSIAIQPGNSSVLLCSTSTGVWRSTDAGASWTNRLTGTSATSVVFDPSNGASAYAALGSPFGSSRNGVYHSTDGGLTWTVINGPGSGGLPSGVNVGRMSVAIAASNPATIFVQVEDLSVGASGYLLGIWKSTDAGITWTRLPITAAQIPLWGNTQWYYNTIAVSPVNPDIVWSGGIQILRSVDGGLTWLAPAQTGPNNSSIHVDFHALAFTPDGSKLYLGNDGGVYSTPDVTASKPNWTTLNNTLAITQFYPGMSLDPTDPTIAVGGTQDNGTQIFDGTLSWANNTCGDGGFTAVDPSFPALGYAACQNISVARTFGLTNSSWMSASYGIDQTDASQFIAPLVIDQANPQTLYFGTYRLWRTQDSAGRWLPVSPDLTGGKKGTLKAVAVAPSDSNTVYIATSNSKLQVSNDLQDGAASAWKDRSAGLPLRVPTQVAVDPVDANTAYVTFSGFSGVSDLLGHVFKTTNGGALWTDISGNLPNLPVNDVVIDPDLPQTLYIGADSGVMVTTDGGATWATLGNGLPLVVVDSLVLQRKARVLRAATHGRSVWDILVPVGGASVQPQISSVSPPRANAGASPLTMSLTGSKFLSQTVVRWNGQARPTTFVDNSHLTVGIPASDLAVLGRAAVSVFNPVAGGGPSNAVNFVIGAAPQSSQQAAVSAANPQGGNNLALRSIASVYGLNLAAGTSVADLAPPLPSTLGGAALTMVSGTQTIPLFFVSPGQINFQVPFITTGAQQLTIIQGTQSVTIPVTLVSYAPALFSTNGQGAGQAATIIANTSIVAAPVDAYPGSRPAKIGEFISIYCTGLGDVSSRPALGYPSPGSPVASTLTKPVVTIGGVPATVSFSGLAPGFVGLYQVNVQVPPTAPTGPAVPIVLTIGGVTSNSVTVALDPAP